MSGQHPDRGFTLIEVLLVILVLGLMTTIVVASAGGFTAEADESACDADRRILATAIERYFAERVTDVITAPGTSADRYEQVLVDAAIIRSVSILHDVQADGQILPAPGSPCVA